jgi:hypothetical protein
VNRCSSRFQWTHFAITPSVAAIEDKHLNYSGDGWFFDRADRIAGTVSFIPGGLGTFEAAAVLMLRIDGISVAVGLSTALLFRGLTFFLPMAPGLWFSRRINMHRTS